MRRRICSSTSLYGVVVLVLAAALGCGSPEGETPAPVAPAAGPSLLDTLQLRTYADTLALRVYDAVGGPAAWEATPYLLFNFAVARGIERRTVYRHAWNRSTGAYRLELPGPANEPYVALMNLHENTGAVYYDGFPLDSVATLPQLEIAFRRMTNDTYWLLAPVKLFDPGVNRTYLPDSSDAATDVLYLTFNGVGMTPGDQYWLYVDKETGRLRQWAYVLQNEPTVPPRYFVWEAYETYEGPAGPLHFATRKRSVGAPYAIHTDGIDVPATVPEDLFTDPRRRLTPEG